MNKSALEARKKELGEELRKAMAAHEEGRLAAGRFKGIVDKAYEEVGEIETTLKAWERGQQFMAAQDQALEPLATRDWTNGGPGMKAVGSGAGPGPGELLRPVSPYDMTPGQLEQLVMAAKHRTPVRIEITPKRYSEPVALKSQPTKWGAVFKTAVSEGSITSSFSAANLPPLQSPHAIGKAYEPTRTAMLFPAYAWNRQALSWLTHSSNAGASAAVAELGTKTDIGEQYDETTVTSTLIAGLASCSLQGIWDTEEYGEANLAAFIPFELQRDLINTESNALLNAVSGTDNYTFNGLTQTSGTLTRAYSDSLTPLDTIAAGINDMRIASGAYCFPDLAITSPSTLLTLRTQKDSTGRYIWDMLRGPAAMSADGERHSGDPDRSPQPYSIVPQGEQPFADHLWNIPVAISSQVEDGTFVLCSVKNGGGMVFQRMGMLIEYNMWAENLWTTNTGQWRCEERIAFAVQRPEAVNIITGLPY